jgi:hypothetical protein
MKKLTCPTATCLAFAFACALVAASPSQAKDEKVKLKDCPTAVQKAIEEKAEGGTIKGIEKATDNNVVSYEAVIKTKDGKEMEAIFTPEGKFVATEMKVKLEECPEAVQKTIKEKTANGKIKEVEKVVAADGKVTYSAEIKPAKGDDMELEVSEKGKVIKFEKDND